MVRRAGTQCVSAHHLVRRALVQEMGRQQLLFRQGAVGPGDAPHGGKWEGPHSIILGCSSPQIEELRIMPLLPAITLCHERQLVTAPAVLTQSALATGLECSTLPSIDRHLCLMLGSPAVQLPVQVAHSGCASASH